MGAGFYYFFILPGKTSPTQVSPAPNTTGTTTTETSKSPPPETQQPPPVVVQPAKPETTHTAKPLVERTDTTTTLPLKNGKVHLLSNVKGASISIDGQSTDWTTPRLLDLPPGDHEISLSKDGYRTGKVVVSVQGGRTISKTVQLAQAETVPPTPVPNPAVPTTTTTNNPPPAAVVGEGSISIVTEPAGLPVLVDDKSIGNSPTHATVSAGADHTFTVTCPGADPKPRTFNVGAGKLKSYIVTCKE